jgi:hypothetical protein
LYQSVSESFQAKYTAIYETEICPQFGSAVPLKNIERMSEFKQPMLDCNKMVHGLLNKGMDVVLMKTVDYLN